MVVCVPVMSDGQIDPHGTGPCDRPDPGWGAARLVALVDWELVHESERGAGGRSRWDHLSRLEPVERFNGGVCVGPEQLWDRGRLAADDANGVPAVVATYW